MGTYLNSGYERYEMAKNSEIFVDKTTMIQHLNSVLNTNRRYVSVSRPRRFGKTMAADMICAYYAKGDSHSLFAKTKITAHENWDKYLNQFDVIRIVMTEFIRKDKKITDSLELMSNRILEELNEEYPEVRYDTSDFIYSMAKFYNKTNKQFIIVIDEWDAPFRECREDKDGQVKYLDFLRNWLKDKPYIALTYMTGILPIKKYGKHSALNMFTEYSMLKPMELAEYTGFTVDEVKTLCDEYKMCYGDIESWYNGYIVNGSIPVNKREEYRQGRYDEQKIHIYSPLSVVNAMHNGIIDNYWNDTETYEALAEYIRKDFDGLKEIIALLMEGGRVTINIGKYQNDMTTFESRDDILTLLIHLGYLSYDSANKEVFIPNKEVLDVFKNSTDTDEWTDTFKSFRTSLELLQATWDCDADKVANLLELAHDSVSNMTYNDEAALSYAIQYAYYAAQKYYTTILELDTGKGYADIIYLPAPKFSDKPALLIELKYDKNVNTAVTQIKKRNYPQRLEHYKGNILLVSINYNKEVGNTSKNYKKHSCEIEKI